LGFGQLFQGFCCVFFGLGTVTIGAEDGALPKPYNWAEEARGEFWGSKKKHQHSTTNPTHHGSKNMGS